MSGAGRTLVTLTAVAGAASGGALLVFSTVVPAALRRLPDAEAMATMQQLNVVVPRSPVFMALLFGPGVAAAVLAARVVVGRHGPGGGLVLAGAAVYLVGVVGTTVLFHVPRNEALAALDAAGSADAWPSWLRTWVAGHHVRTLSGFVASGLLLASGAVRD